jgi:hypothetical protein
MQMAINRCRWRIQSNTCRALTFGRYQLMNLVTIAFEWHVVSRDWINILLVYAEHNDIV